MTVYMYLRVNSIVINIIYDNVIVNVIDKANKSLNKSYVHSCLSIQPVPLVVLNENSKNGVELLGVYIRPMCMQRNMRNNYSSQT